MSKLEVAADETNEKEPNPLAGSRKKQWSLMHQCADDQSGCTRKMFTLPAKNGYFVLCQTLYSTGDITDALTFVAT